MFTKLICIHTQLKRSTKIDTSRMEHNNVKYHTNIS